MITKFNGYSPSDAIDELKEDGKIKWYK